MYSRQELRKEKCTRDIVRKEVKSNEVLRLTFEQLNENEDKMGDTLVLGAQSYAILA